MGEQTAIEWCDHSFNPWIGCDKISPACDHCYAEAYAKRTGQANLWKGDRHRTSALNWNQVSRWDRAARAANVRRRVFCASLADIFDNKIDPSWRADLMRTIASTTHLDFLLLTKRIGNATAMLEAALGEIAVVEPWSASPWPNVWIGATVVTQEEADRDIPKLLATPAARRFLSIEPMLGPINLTHVGDRSRRRTLWMNTLEAKEANPAHAELVAQLGPDYPYERIDWVIVGGESGGAARPMHPQWPRDIRDQCASAGVPFHFKQWGEWRPPHVCEEFSTAKGRDQPRPAFIVSRDDGTVHCFHNEHIVDGKPMLRVGKKVANRLLDGLMHDGFPESAAL